MPKEDERRAPEEFLIASQEEESRKKRGKLKIFLGMAAGVGKTYAMLEEAHSLIKQGIDITIGIIDTHGRKETVELLAGLPQIPEKIIPYAGTEFKELDLESIIQKRPQIVLIDELAHSNIPGSRHEKRWQDVVEILDSGIDVYSTLNVQHIESLNDSIAGITGISVKETVPDLVVEKATSIQLIDITPGELLKRLNEGKVYLKDQSQIAIRNFFREDRLTALREIVLRFAANKLDQDLHLMVPTSEWKPREKYLVAVSHSPHSQKLIRTTKRLASESNATWCAVQVNDGSSLNEEDNDQLIKNLSKARDLGAEVITVNDLDIANGIERIARQRGVTQIIIGRSPSKKFWGIFTTYTFVDSLIDKCKDIDIHIIRQEKHAIHYRNKKLFAGKVHKKRSDYFLALLSVGILSGLNLLSFHWLSVSLTTPIFFVGILFLSLFFKKGPIFFATLMVGLVWLLFFTPPNPAEFNENIAKIFLLLCSGFGIGMLIDRVRDQNSMMIKNEESTQALYGIVRLIASAPSLDEMKYLIEDRLAKLFGGTFEFVIKEINQIISLSSSRLITNDKEKQAAQWCFENDKEAGWSTNTLPSVENFYLPLKGLQNVVGIMIHHPATTRSLSFEDKNLLHTVCQQYANRVERVISDELTMQLKSHKQVDAAQKTILKRFAYTIEEPVLRARKAIDELGINSKLNSDPKFETKVKEIESAFTILVQILSNVSAMTQLIDGMAPLKMSKHLIEEVIDECCHNLKKSIGNHRLELNIQEGIGHLYFDYYLMHILFHNLILNALEYSPPSSAVKIAVEKRDRTLIVSVSDEGKGIPEEDLEAIFDKFYRSSDTQGPGMGLGLSICKTITEIHGGKLIAENLPQGGARFTLILSLSQNESYAKK